MSKCMICGKEFNKLASHISQKHKNITTKEYYDKYLKQENEGICKCCGKPTNFNRFADGYFKFCSNKCATNSSETKHKREQTNIKKFGVINTFNTKMCLEKSHNKEANRKRTKSIQHTTLLKYGANTVLIKPSIQYKARLNSHTNISNNKRAKSYKNNVTKFEKHNNCTQVKKLIDNYGQGWLKIKQDLNCVYNNRNCYIKNSEITLIEDYYNKSKELNFNHISSKELKLVEFLLDLSLSLETNNRSIISPFELDIFIPELNLAIEYNGTYWHSNLFKDKNYHLNKSILCRDKGIRLIHIYEFEDFNTQLYLLSELINGNDLYNNKDFNKNNLISIPAPELIYKDNRVLVYGAGKLY